MGYTHYFEVKFSDNGWEKFRKDVRKLFKSLPETVKIQREYDNDSRPLNGKDKIVFNGVGDDGHETFWLDKNGEWAFCKTAQKPYDLAVCCVLMLASWNGISGKISSDGINEAHGQWPDNVDQEWKDAWKHLQTVFPGMKIQAIKESVFTLFPDKEMILRMID